MTLPYLPIVVLSVCAIVFYRAGKMERSSGGLWAALSIAASFLALRFLSWGLVGVLLAQVVLFAGITMYRVWRKPPMT
jgi:hypothetical protein